MSQLLLTKSYGDLTLLFADDVHDMWTELEAKTNGNIDSDNVNNGWAKWSQVTLEKDEDYSLGDTESGIVRFYSATNQFVFAHDTTARETIFKIAGTEVARINSDADFTAQKDIYFYNSSTTYPLSYLLSCQKPVLVYVDSTTINVEQNVVTGNTSLVIFPTGPVAVTEDVSLTHKFRQLKTSATANGYDSGHTGAADSGLRDGISITSNTWYFVYAVVVQYGDDAGTGFILVVDTTSPIPSNWSTLDTRYGAGMWVYLGIFRCGYGSFGSTTLIPFLQDHQGWHTFVDRGASGDYFGIEKDDDVITSTSYTTLESFSTSDVPSTCSFMKVLIKVRGDGDSDFHGNLRLVDGSDNVIWHLPSFGANLTDSEAHGWELKVPNTSDGLTLKGRRGTGATSEDFQSNVYISAVLDEWA